MMIINILLNNVYFTILIKNTVSYYIAQIIHPSILGLNGICVSGLGTRTHLPTNQPTSSNDATSKPIETAKF